MLNKDKTIDSCGNEELPTHSWKTSLTIIFFFIVTTTFLLFAGYGVWTFYSRGEIKKHINTMTIIDHAQKIQINKMRKEIQELRLAQRWDMLLQIILNPDRQIEFDVIEEHLAKEIYAGTLRNKPPDMKKEK